MNIKPGCIAAMVAAGLGLGGCVIKHNTYQPAAQIVVTDGVGAPLKGANVVLGTYSGFRAHVELKNFVTDQDGRAELQRIRKWEVEISLPDADTGYGWSLCVSKPGYQAVPIFTPEFERPIQISMPPSAVTSECRWNSQSRLEIVDWNAGQWIEVEGGSWTLDKSAMLALTDDLRSHAEVHATAMGQVLRPWSEYLFQYQGRMSGTTQYVYIKALCQTPAGVNLRKTFYDAKGGGSCFLELTYDMTRARFDSFAMNDVEK